MAARLRTSCSEDGAIEIASVAIVRRERSLRGCSPKSLSRARNELLAMIRDDLRRAGLEKQIPAGIVLVRRRRAGCTDCANWSSKHCTCRCALRSPKVWLKCRNRLLSRNMQRSWDLAMYGAKARRATPKRAGNLVSKLKAMFAGAVNCASRGSAPRKKRFWQRMGKVREE